MTPRRLADIGMELIEEAILSAMPADGQPISTQDLRKALLGDEPTYLMEVITAIRTKLERDLRVERTGPANWRRKSLE